MMIIADAELHTLWYENDAGDRWFPNFDRDFPDAPPAGFIYQHAEFSRRLLHQVLRLIVESEVEACAHTSTQPTYGWIEGHEGRRCTECNGSQLREVGTPWPENWNACGVREVAAGECSYPIDLSIALYRPSLMELLRAVMRYGRPGRRFRAEQAQLVAGRACARCMNALAHRYGLRWGYREGSAEWKRARTSCRFCINGEE
jgi:hypothetical protein